MYHSKIKVPILVTGSHRSGTTWVGNILSKASGVAYVHEPFNIQVKQGMVPESLDYQYLHINRCNEESYKAKLNNVIEFDYPIGENIKVADSFKDYARIPRDQIYFSWHKIKRDQPLIKDPLAFFSAEWLYEKYGVSVLIMLRHPAAFCASLKVKNWTFNFNNFLEQEDLISTYLHPFRDDIYRFSREKKSIIDQGILLWNCIYNTASIYKKQHPDWLIVKHESLAKHPYSEFRSIFNRLELPFTQKVTRAIYKSSGAHNPVEGNQGEETKRNSKEVVKNWKSRLSESEIEHIKTQTDSVARQFYSEEEW